jgi:methylphosphotriester-DNA--protein-cysteine methyltransferase
MGMKKYARVWLSALFVPAILFSSEVRAQDGKFVAATYSDRFHRADCKIVRKIDAADLVSFEKPEEAIAAGFVPCKKCAPPASSEKKR